jgi:Cytochrome P460
MQPTARPVQGAVWLSAKPCAILHDMITKATTVLLIGMVLLFAAAFRESAAPPSSGQESTPQPTPQYSPESTPQYTSDGQLKFPEHYRDWVYLTTGFDMSYNPAMRMGHHMFDNVFVNPEAYKTFVNTGTWPDKTVLLIEARGAKDKGSINQAGNYQDTEVMAVEVHVKDESRFPGKWAFFGFDDAGFDDAKTAKMIPATADCYSCHAAHAAVDTTFVQFYPTLLPIAKSKGTLAASYQKEVTTTEKKTTENK